MFNPRAAINVGNGVRLNLSKSGVGISVGKKGMRVGVTAKGSTYISLNIPGTGITMRKKIH
jgi:hypothetical protein